MAAAELADWWDKQHRDSNHILEEWVENNPQWWAVGLATTGATAMDLGHGVVDALRFSRPRPGVASKASAPTRSGSSSWSGQSPEQAPYWGVWHTPAPSAWP